MVWDTETRDELVSGILTCQHPKQFVLKQLNIAAQTLSSGCLLKISQQIFQQQATTLLIKFP